MATYVIGDIHGGYRALQQVLNLAPIHAGDRLIFIGDYVDGWSQNFEVVQRLIYLGEQYECIFLLGNHDLWIYRWLAHDEKPKVWLENGGKGAIESYKGATAGTLAAHRKFFGALKYYFIDEEKRLFVHGGFTHPDGIEKEEDTLTLITDRSLWKTAQQLDFDKRYSLYSHIFIGHTPTLRMGSTKPVTIRNVHNTDTGAAFTGRLTIMNIDTFEYWQSDPLPLLYPDEKGRN